jgi:hypothetical protein
MSISAIAAIPRRRRFLDQLSISTPRSLGPMVVVCADITRFLVFGLAANNAIYR